jgi:hypothetical protein
MSKICAKIYQKWRGYKLMKKVIKNDRFWVLKKWVENDQKCQFMGGGLKWSKIVKFRPRGPGPPKTEFFEISAFFAKAPPFLTPKIDPHKWPYWKTHSPQIGCAFAPMGGSKIVNFGGSEGGPLGPKNVDTTI